MHSLFVSAFVRRASIAIENYDVLLDRKGSPSLSREEILTYIVAK
jgi:hypothetical protein